MAHSSEHPRPGASHDDSAPASGMIFPADSSKVVAFFDLDKTIIATSSVYVYGREFLHSGLISPATALQISIAKATYMIAGHSSEQMDTTRDQLAQMIVGWSEEQVKTIATETMHSLVTPTIYEEARELIRMHQEAGHDVVIISASARILVEPIAQELGVETVVATELVVKDGKFTGEMPFYCKGEMKAQAIAELTQQRGYALESSFAYSDSVTDLPMLEAVGHPVVVNPDRALRRIATEKGWEVRTFKNPVPLFPKPTMREVQIGTGVAAGVAAMLGGVVWWNKRTDKRT